jgi:hypothetical protein
MVNETLVASDLTIRPRGRDDQAVDDFGHTGRGPRRSFRVVALGP